MSEVREMSASEKKNEDWMNAKWRPMMGWMYMAVCVADFVLFPVLWSMVQAVHGGNVTSQWQPITLQGAGLFHLAMGAVLGIAAFGRTQEKLNGANNGGLQMPGGLNSPSSIGGGFSPVSMNSGFNPAPMSSSYSNNANSMGGGFTPTQVASNNVMRSSSGKPMPVQPDMPVL